MISRGRTKQTQPSPPPCSYEAPRLTKLTAEQAKLKLLGHLSVGDEGAKELLDLLFAAPEMVASAPQPPQEPGDSLRRTG